MASPLLLSPTPLSLKSSFCSSSSLYSATTHFHRRKLHRTRSHKQSLIRRSAYSGVSVVDPPPPPAPEESKSEFVASLKLKLLVFIRFSVMGSVNFDGHVVGLDLIFRFNFRIVAFSLPLPVMGLVNFDFRGQLWGFDLICLFNFRMVAFSFASSCFYGLFFRPPASVSNL